MKAMKEGGVEAGVKNIEDQIVDQYRRKNVTTLEEQCGNLLSDWGALPKAKKGRKWPRFREL